jgi:hypothetical protein
MMAQTTQSSFRAGAAGIFAPANDISRIDRPLPSTAWRTHERSRNGNGTLAA